MGINVEGYLTAYLFSGTAGWTIEEVQIPQSEVTAPVQLTFFQTEIQVFDAYQNPAPNVEVVLSAQTAIGVNVLEQSYVVGPDDTQQPTLTTAGLGRLNISTFAFSLTAHEITVTTPDGTQASIAPDQPIVDYFTGTASLNDLPTFSGDTLLNATNSDGTPLAPTLQQYNGLADSAASALQLTMSLKNTSADSTTVYDPASQSQVYGYTLDLTGPTNPVYTPHTSPDAVTTARLALHEAVLGGFLHDLDKFGHDIWHGIKSGVATVSHWVVDVEKKTVSIITTIAKGIQGAVDLALSDLEAIGSVAHSIFHAIGAAVDKVIDWLKAIFSWGDIINTKKAIEYYINGCFPALQNTLSSVENIADDFFAKQEDHVRTAFSNLKAKVGDQSLSQLGQTGQSALATMAASSSSPPTADTFTKGPKSNWMLNKVLHAAGQDGTTTDFSSQLKDDFTNLLNTFESSWTSFESDAQTFAATC